MAVGLVGAVATLATALAPAAQALSSTPAKTYVTDGYVDAIAPTPSAIYIGGFFTEVGSRTGPGVGINSSTAKSTGLPPVSGGKVTVEAVAPDGSGGFYIGGNFTHVGALPRRNLAHILANGSVDPQFGNTNPSSGNGPIEADVSVLAVSGSTVYAGGRFSSIGGKARNGLAALDATGAATSWNPSPDGSIGALAVSGSTVYAGGSFTSIGGKTRNGIAALNVNTGAATSWNPDPYIAGCSYICYGPVPGSVDALAVSGSTVYASGSFTSIGGQDRSSIAALDSTTGNATSWNPSAGGGAHALAVSDTTLYAGGSGVTALDRTSGATSWHSSADRAVDALTISGSTVYAGGTFSSIGGEDRSKIAALNATTGAATSWNPSVDKLSQGDEHFAVEGSVSALAVSGSTVYAGGAFNSIGGKARSNVAALDPATGAVTNWNPSAGGDGNADGQVHAFAVSGSTVYAGGDFTSIGGQPRDGVAALNRTTGAATGWYPKASATYGPDRPLTFALAVSGPTIYVGGHFDHMGGKVRNGVAAIDANTGAATTWNPNVASFGAPGWVSALRVSGSTVYAGGFFDSVGGKTRNNIAALDATTGKATSWNPNANYGVEALRLWGSTVYAGGQFTSIGGKARNGLAALDATTGKARIWNPNADGEVTDLALSGSTVYAGGRFHHIGGRARNYSAALDRSTGKATSWNPNANDSVWALAFGPNGSLWVGGAFFGFPTATQSGTARFDP